jgi:uncharacterized protein YegP (UPF0339 family)
MALHTWDKGIAAMPTRYEYDLDHNGEWRWIAVAESGETQAVSPVGYAHLQDCLYAVALLQAPGEPVILPSVQAAAMKEADDPPEQSLSRLQRRPSMA